MNKTVESLDNDDDEGLEGYIYYEIDGSMHYKDSIEEMARFYQQLQRDISLIQNYMDEVKSLLWEKTEGDKKTRHLESDNFQVKIVEGNKNPNSSLLTYARNAFPEEAKEFIVPSGWRVAAAKYKKMLSTSYENKKMKELKQLLVEAFETGNQSPPTVSVSMKEHSNEETA